MGNVISIRGRQALGVFDGCSQLSFQRGIGWNRFVFLVAACEALTHPLKQGASMDGAVEIVKMEPEPDFKAFVTDDSPVPQPVAQGDSLIGLTGGIIVHIENYPDFGVGIGLDIIALHQFDQAEPVVLAGLGHDPHGCKRQIVAEI